MKRFIKFLRQLIRNIVKASKETYKEYKEKGHIDKLVKEFLRQYPMSAVDVCYAPNSMHEIAVFHEDVAQRHRHMTYWEQAIKGLPFTVKVRHVAGTIANGNPSNITSCRGSECRIFASNPFAAFAREAGMEDKIMSYYQLDHAPEECSECEYIRDLKAELAKGNKDEEAE